MARTQTESRQLARSPEVHEQLAALWAVIQRHWGAVAVSILVMLVAGLLYFLRAPRTYESRTQIQLVTKHFSVSGDQQEQPPAFENTIETHKVVISSPTLVSRAVRDFGLDKLDSLSGVADPVAAILENLDAEVKEDNTTVLELAYRSGNAMDCQQVLQAMNATYSAYLSESNHQIGKEAMDLISKANDDLLEQLRGIEANHGEFQKSAPLMWRDGQGVNIHHERQLQIEAARQDLLVQHAVMSAKIKALEAALASGGLSRDAVYYEALMELRLNEQDTDLRAAQLAEQEQFAERTALREYASLLVGEYVRLWVEESEKLDSFGQGHPDVESVTKRKELVHEMLKAMQRDQQEIADNLIAPLEPATVEEGRDYVSVYLQLLRDRLTVIDSQIASLDDEFTVEQRKANVMQEHLITDRRLRNDYETTRELFDVVVARLREVNILRDSGGDVMYILAEPNVGLQVAPMLLFVMFGSVMLGGLIGTGLAVVVDHSERTFRNWTEIREALELPVIGGIPVLSHVDTNAVPKYAHLPASLCTVHDEGCQPSEAFRGVRTNLYYSTSKQNYKVIQVTSPLPGDGKSTLTANLAVSIAKSGKRVLVLDADFRRPTIAGILGVDVSTPGLPGLGSVITGEAELEQALSSTVVENLFVVPARERPRQPSELLTTSQFSQFLSKVKSQYDFVLIDTPPLLPVTDPSVVAAQVDGVLLTVRVRRGVRVAAQRAVERLRSVNAKVLGVVVNGWEGNARDSVGTHDYGFGYGYGYGDAYGNGESPQQAERMSEAAATFQRNGAK